MVYSTFRGVSISPCPSSVFVLRLFPQVFADIFDPIILDRHNGYDPHTMKHPADLDASKVPVSTFPSETKGRKVAYKWTENSNVIPE